jgi:hypothetical protein
MSQETNLNVSPYFDDFDINNDYYKVLFKPGYPVQARELTTLQSILQNQIEQFGKHIFKDGSPVIGGEVNFISPVYAVQISSTHNGLPIELYIDQIIDRNFIGSNSGVKAQVLGFVRDIESEKSNYTLYLKYNSGGGPNFENSKFFELEDLITESTLVTERNLTLQSGQTVFNTLSTGGIEYQGSLCEVKGGIFFIRGYFIKSITQKIITSQYTPNDNYKVGFQIIESVVTADQDPSLYDNAAGFSNYAAPGADRFGVDLVLTTKRISDNDSDFLELLRIENGQPQYIVSKTVYSLIRDELASRTYDESGDYLVRPFTVFARETLNDGYKVLGLYKQNQITPSGNTPSEGLITYQIGAGKAYVGGYDVETIAPTLIDIPKPRTTKRVENKVISYNAGSLAILNNVYGVPTIGIGATIPVSLIDSRLGSSKTVAVGTTIGYARIYDFIPETQYIDNTSRMEVRLFDIDMFVKLTLTSNITLSSSSRIEGQISKATGFLKESITSSNTLTLYSVSGTFMDNEPIIINGVDSNRFVSKATKYEFFDAKSLYSSVGISTFTGDFVLSSSTRLSNLDSQFLISGRSSGISTVTTGFLNVFTNKVKSGDIISYNNPNFGNIPVYNKVESVSAGGTFFTISGITTVSGICDGSLPSSNTTVNGIIKVQSNIDINDSSLITALPNLNVSYIDLQNNNILQRRQFSNVSFSASQISVSITEEDLFFADFDEDNFVISYSDGSLETLRSQMYSLSGDGKTLTFIGLKKSNGTANVIATLVNTEPSSIKKDLNKLTSITINKSIYTQSGIGTTTLNDGLTYNQYYGLRVQDKDISLNIPDVIRVLAIYESSNTADPILPSLSLASFNGIFNSTSQLKPGDIFEGNISNSVAVVASILNSSDIEYVSFNDNTFTKNEKITFKESEITAVITDLTLGSRNVTGNYLFDSGHTASVAEYSKIVRKNNVSEPKGKLRIICKNYTSNAIDTGEFITINSYSGYDYGFDIPPSVLGIRASDIVDLRPRLKPFTLTNKSPFEYDGKQLGIAGKYSSYVLAPNKNLILNYEYYLPRIDVVSLNTQGKFEVLQGIPSDDPKLPQLKRNSLDIAVIFLPPYLYSFKDAIVDMSIHKRYRMSDISLLEGRIQRIEEVTALNLLESETDSIIIRDAETGLNRFKSGFFADNFVNETFSDVNNSEFKSYVYKDYGSLGAIPIVRNLDLQLGSEAISGFTTSYNPNIDYTFVTDLGSPGIKKTGEIVTLNYSEIPYISQPYASIATNISGVPIIYNGDASLSPSEDTWYEEKIIDRNTFAEGTTTTAKTPTVENITRVINQKGPDIIRYVDPPKSVSTWPTNPPAAAAAPSPAPTPQPPAARPPAAPSTPGQMIIAGIIVEGPNTGARADASTVVNPAALGAVNAQAAQFAALSAAGQAAELAKAAAELAKFGLPLPR